MKVVVIVGTKGPFPRLVDAVAQWASRRPDTQVWVQHAGGGLPAGFDGAAMAPHEVVSTRLAGADVVICHAGSGTIRDALKLGHRPVVVPRLARFGEHVNDHQLELVEALADRIVACPDPENPASLGRAIAAAGRGQVVDLPGDALRSDIREALGEVGPAKRTPLVWNLLDLATRPFGRWLRKS